MESCILINSTPFENRTALIENGQLIELHIETEKDKTILGSIYKGRVVKIISGIQAAFVEIGTERSAFLPLSETGFEFPPLEKILGEGLQIPKDDSMGGSTRKKGNEKELKEGQSQMVQVIKEPIGDKGARLTTYITLPGRYLVYMPSFPQIGISHRISDPQERQRLKRGLLNSGVREDEGFIVRTASIGVSEREIRDDIRYLRRLFADIRNKYEKKKAPALIREEINLTERVIRDLFLPGIEKVYVDDREEYHRIRHFTGALSPRLKNRIELYQKKDPLFEFFGIEGEIQKLLQRRVWLKSGGYLTFDITEALISIDVNSGKYTGERNLEETSLSINLEAVKEITYQLRLRDLGGIIIIDFIDMEKEGNRKKVLRAMEEALKKDRARCNIVRFSDLGLLEMTRKKVREDIRTRLTEPCIYCKGNGVHLSKETIIYSLFRKLLRTNEGSKGECVYVSVHPLIADTLFGSERKNLDGVEKRLKKKVIVKTSANLHIEDYDISFK